MNYFISLLTVLFIGLKLTGYIDWSWVWILSPIWIMFILDTIAGIILAWMDSEEDKKYKKKKLELLNE